MSAASSGPGAQAPGSASTGLARRHVVHGWWWLLLFLSLGALLEAFHGLKLGFYLDISSATRRLMWTLAHAHGVLLALVNIAFGVSLRAFPPANVRLVRIASRCLSLATLLLPFGFLLGGVFVHGGDPSLGILLVPAGAALLFVSVLLTARALAE